VTYPSRIEAWVEVGCGSVRPDSRWWGSVRDIRWLRHRRATWLLADSGHGTEPGPVKSIAPTYRANRRAWKVLALRTKGCGIMQPPHRPLKNSEVFEATGPVRVPRSPNSALTGNWNSFNSTYALSCATPFQSKEPRRRVEKES
jgi:hypothetical protein